MKSNLKIRNPKSLLPRQAGEIRSASAISEFPNFRIFTFAFLLSVICGLRSNGQAVTATLKVDTTHIVIGDQLHAKLSVNSLRNLKVTMPTPDSIGNMEIVSASKIDTGHNANDIVYTQNFVVSAYDSGLYHAGPVMVFVQNANGDMDTVWSNDIPVLVSTVAVDTTKPFKPIKAPLAVPYSWKEYIPYIFGGLLLLIVLVVGGYFYLQYLKKQRAEQIARPKPKDPPHIWARKELKKLEEEKIWQKDDVKLYYSRLTDILRLYLEFRFDWLALESTTEEIEENIDNYITKEKAKEQLIQILKSADLVKFAKMLHSPEVNIKAMESAYKFIDLTEPKEQEPIINK